jgi:hypothetical protein
MQEFKNLEQSMKFISASLLESLTMLDILDELIVIIFLYYFCLI